MWTNYTDKLINVAYIAYFGKSCLYVLAYLGLFALQVENFKYLGMHVNERKQRSTEIQKRMQAANNP
jgi:hypothetical protein